MAGFGSAGSLWVKLGLSSKQFDTSLKKAENDLKKFGDRLNNIGSRLTVGLSIPLALVSGAAIKLGMDAVESENLFSVSMGKMADSARKWSEDLRKNLGLNSYEVRKNVGTFNVMLTSMGLTEKAAFDMSKGLTQLAYDMASFYNLNPEEAFTKLQSGISGESEPLKRLGILVNETTTKNYALTHGMLKQGKQLSETGKVAARYGTIMEATSKAQGDMARTLDSPANKMRVLQSRIQQMAIDLGTALLPAFQSLMTAFQPLIQMISNVAAWFNKLSPETQILAGYLIAITVAIGPLIQALGVLYKTGAGLVGLFRIITTSGIVKAIQSLGTAFITMATGETAAAAAATSLAAAFTPFLVGAAVIAGLVGIVALIKKFRNASKDAIKNYEKLAAAQESKKNVDNLAQAYKKLMDKINNAKPNSKEWKELKKQQQELMNQIAENYPSVVTAYDAIGNAREIDIELLKKQLKLEDELDKKRLKKSRKQAREAAQSILNKATKNVDFIQSQIKEIQEMTPAQWVAKYRMGMAKTTSIGGINRSQFDKEANELYKKQELRLNNQLKAQLKAQEKARAQLDKVMGKPKIQTELEERVETRPERPKIGEEEDKRSAYKIAKEKWETARDVSDWAPEEALRQWNAMVGGTAKGKEIEDFKQKQGKLTKIKLEAELKAQNELALARLDGYDRQLEDLKQQEADELSESKIGEQRKKNIQDRYAIERNKVIAERDKQALIDKANTNALQMELEAQTLEDQGKYTEAAIKQEEAKWERAKATLSKGTDAYKLEYQKYLNSVATIQKDADEKLRAAQIESQKSKIDDQIQGLEYQIEEAELLDDEAKSQKLVADLQKKINDLKIKRIDIDIAELRRQKDTEKDATKRLEIENKITDALRERIGLKKDNAIIDLQLKPIPRTFAENWQKGLDETFKDWNDWATNIKSIAQQTAQSMQSAFSDGFLNVLKGNFDDLEDDVTNFLDSILRQITDMWSKTITQKVMKGGVGNWIGNLFNSAGGVAENAVETTGKTALNTATIAAATSMTTLGITSGTLSSTLGLLSAAAQTAAASLSSMGLSSTFAGGFAEGGYIPPGQWGIMGERGPEPIFAGKTGATILPKSSLNNGGGGGNVSINIINNAGNQVTARVTSKKTDSTGNQAITLVMDSISKNANGSRDFFRALGRS